MEKNWKRIESRQGGSESEFKFMKWVNEGDSAERTWKGTMQGKYGLLGLVEQEDNLEMVAFPLHTVLENKLKDVAEGTPVRIEYLGKVTGKSGREYKDFDVFTSD